MATGTTGDTGTSGTSESPATLYGPVSIGLGVIALLVMYFYGVFAILAGILAVTFGLLGLAGKDRGNRTLCAIGFVLGAFGALAPFTLLFLYSGGS
ncbi:hypothetical protein ACIOD0_11745 [Kitasatospora albolonga]